MPRSDSGQGLVSVGLYRPYTRLDPGGDRGRVRRSDASRPGEEMPSRTVTQWEERPLITTGCTREL